MKPALSPRRRAYYPGKADGPDGRAAVIDVFRTASARICRDRVSNAAVAGPSRAIALYNRHDYWPSGEKANPLPPSRRSHRAIQPKHPAGAG